MSTTLCETTGQAETLTEIQADVSVVIGHESEATAAQQMASATVAMRRMRGIQRAIDSIEEVKRLEVASIESMAERELAPLRAKLAIYEQWVESLSLLIPWPKRKKSHETQYGTFGIRTKPASVKVADSAVLLAWAETHAPKYVAQVPTLAWGELKKTLDASEDVLPPGVERVPESVTAYAKVAA